MSSNHESQSFYVENEKKLRHAARLDKVYFMLNTVGAGMVAGTIIGFILDIVRGTIGAAGTGTIAGAIIGGLIGAIFLYLTRHRPYVELRTTTRGRDAEPPRSV